MAKWLRKYHKWLSLIIGVQMMIWIASGAYMVLMDLDFIHGDHLVEEQQVLLPEPGGIKVSLAELLQRYPETTSTTLTSLMGRPVYQLTQSSVVVVINAETGEPLGPIDRQRAIELANYHYSREADVASAVLIERDPPGELGSRPLPAWQINYDDFGNTSFYISAHTGALMTKRHDFWRLFDVMWMLHIMDYETRDDVHNLLLTLSALLGLLAALSGIGLTYYRFKRQPKRHAGR